MLQTWLLVLFGFHSVISHLFHLHTHTHDLLVSPRTKLLRDAFSCWLPFSSVSFGTLLLLPPLILDLAAVEKVYFPALGFPKIESSGNSLDIGAIFEFLCKQGVMALMVSGGGGR